MQKIISLIIGLFFLGNISAQILEPVHWSTEAKHLSGDEYELIYTAKMDENWAVYSQFLDEGGPIPTTLNYDDESLFTKIGKASESGHKKTGFDKLFDMEVTKFINDAVFVQKIKVKDISKPITGYINFMTCDMTRCLPPNDIDFKFDLSKLSNQKEEKTEIKIEKKKTSKEIKPEIKKPETEKPEKIKKVEKQETKSSSKIEVEKSSPIDNSTAKSGILKPVTWSFSSNKVSENEFDLVFTAKIDEHWSVYSHFIDEGGPVPTSLFFDEDSNIELVGKHVESGEKHEGFDDIFKMDVTKFKHNFILTQKIKIKDSSKPVKGYLEFMTCDEKQCLPPEPIDFEFNLGSNNNSVKEVNNNSKYDLDTKGEGTPVYQDFDKTNENVVCGNANTEDDEKSKSLWWIFFWGIVGGFAALITPCVFPMIPLTVSFFTKSSTTRAKGIRNALLYGFSIIIIYLTLGLLITGIFGADALNALSTNVYFNIAFFVLFIVFAISFFGYFEITLPSSWSNKADSQADKGGLLGIFFMAFTLSLVSFSCTGPIIGTLLVQAATGSGATIFGGYIAVAPLVGMFGFALALALPFALFALFPSWLNSLPRSGSWMDDVKVTLGFIEVALAFKFLSIADLVMGWSILPYELFVVVWALCAFGLGLYYFGKVKFIHTIIPKKISLIKKIAGILMIILGFVFLSGLQYDKRSESFKSTYLLSGLAPPVGHSWIYPKECPLDINCYHDFDLGLEAAKAANKPILLDFTGYGCVNCRRMEDQVWGQKGVYEHISDDYILISLYVDEKKALEEKYTSKFSGKTVRTYGGKWSDFQAIHFNKNSQPWYVLMSPDLEILNQPVGYTPDVKTYQTFLECGLENFNKSN